MKRYVIVQREVDLAIVVKDPKLEEEDLRNFEFRVERLLAEGYELAGGVSVTAGGGKRLYSQALVRHESKK
jgi:hypothetical protein